MTERGQPCKICQSLQLWSFVQTWGLCVAVKVSSFTQGFFDKTVQRSRRSHVYRIISCYCKSMDFVVRMANFKAFPESCQKFDYQTTLLNQIWYGHIQEDLIWGWKSLIWGWKSLHLCIVLFTSENTHVYKHIYIYIHICKWWVVYTYTHHISIYGCVKCGCYKATGSRTGPQPPQIKGQFPWFKPLGISHGWRDKSPFVEHVPIEYRDVIWPSKKY